MQDYIMVECLYVFWNDILFDEAVRQISYFGRIKNWIELNWIKWPLDDLCGKSWLLITKITVAADSLTKKAYKSGVIYHSDFFHFF